MPWNVLELSDTVRSMIKATPESAVIYLNPQAEKRDPRITWVQSENDNITIWDPPFSILPTRYNIHRLRNKLGAMSLPAFAERNLGSNWRDNTIVYVTPTTLEQSYDYVKALNPKYLIFDILDDNLNFPSISSQKRQTLTEKFIYIAQRATVVTAVSEYLVKQTEDIASITNVYYLPNGVDVSKFEKFTNVPSEMIQIQSPRITFVGAITSWIDIELLEKITAELKEFQFVLVGPVDTDNINMDTFTILKGRKNVHLLGPKPYDEVPNYLYSSDVLLLPRTTDPYSLACDPLKLYEYLVTGKPIVSTAHPSISRYSEFVYSGNTSEEISSAIRDAISRNEEVSLQQRQLKDSLSWETRVNKLFKYFYDKISKV